VEEALLMSDTFHTCAAIECSLRQDWRSYRALRESCSISGLLQYTVLHIRGCALCTVRARSRGEVIVVLDHVAILLRRHQ